MKREKLAIAILCALTVLLAAGCNAMDDYPMNDYPMGDSAQNGTKAEEGEPTPLEALGGLKPGELPDTLKFEVSDTLSFDAELRVSNGLEGYQVPTLSVTRHLLDPSGDMDKLLDYFQVTDIGERAYHNKGDFLENGQEIYLDYVVTDNGGYLQVRDLYLSARLSEDTDIYHFGYLYNESLSALLRENEELDFSTIENAKAAAQDFFDRMGIDVMEEPRVYAASQQTIEDIALKNRETMASLMSEKELETMFPRDIAKEQEAYYLIYRQGYQGVPYMAVAVDTSLSNSYNMTVSYCDLIYTEDGICEVDSHCLYDIEQVHEAEEILSLQEILQQYIDLYKDYPQSRLVRGVDLEYLLVLTDKQSMTFEAKPVWNINVQKSVTEEEQIPERVIFDAATGEVLKVLNFGG